MPTLDWLDRQAAFKVANKTPTHVLRPHVANDLKVSYSIQKQNQP